MKRNTYEAPQMEIAEVEAEDIITTSRDPNELPVIPTKSGTQDLELQRRILITIGLQKEDFYKR